VIATLPSDERVRLDRAKYIVECMESLGDELYQIVFEPDQTAWPSRDIPCPWCRLMERQGFIGAYCPICNQIVRAVFEGDS
jgi:hypothetical protein